MSKILWITLLITALFIPSMAQDSVVSIGSNEELGEFLTAANGMTLYTFANDEPNVSNCIDGCLEAWPAFTVESTAFEVADNIPGTISFIQRPDNNEFQVTYDGMPLYFFGQDLVPGDTNGQGAGDVWFVVSIAPTPTSNAILSIAANTELGNILVDENGFTLYTFANDTAGVSNCVGNCLDLWPPLLLPVGAELPTDIQGDFNTIERTDDGSSQITFNDFPLYTYSADINPGDVSGQGVGNVWFVIEAQPAPKVSSANIPNFGNLLVDGNGLTLYTFSNDEPGVSNCVGQCLELWPPFVVEPGSELLFGDDMNMDAFGALIDESGRSHITYNDAPLYTFRQDITPGDVNGQGVGNVWFAVSTDTIQIGGNDELGTFATAPNGMTLYTFANDEPGWSNCVGDCAATWPPYTVESEDTALSSPHEEDVLSTSLRADGTYQVVMNDQPLYFFSNDEKRGDANGHGAGDVWFTIATELPIIESVSIEPVVPAPVATEEVAALTCSVTPVAGSVNVRTEMNTNAAIVVQLQFGSYYEVAAQTIGEDGFTWWQLEPGAWVREDVVNELGNCAGVPTFSA